MTISAKKARLIINLISCNSALAIIAFTLVSPQTKSWKVSVVLLSLMIVTIILSRELTKLLLPILIDSYSPKYNSKLKNQLWGVLMRLVSGAIGLILLSFILPIPSTIYFITTAIYMIVVYLGFINDGKAFEKYNTQQTVNSLAQIYRGNNP